jgi:hypothetical protein
MFSNSLEAMVYVGDREVRRENRHGIAEDQVIVSIGNSLLTLRKIIETEETLLFRSIFFCHISRAAFDPSGVVLEADGKPPARQISFSDSFKRFIALLKILPGIPLF